MKNTDICVVTSFNNKLYESYAYNFINTYNLPFDLYIYSEDTNNNFKNLKKNMTVIPLLTNNTKLQEFYKNNNNYQQEKYLLSSEKWKWKYDCIRFSYKVFSIVHNYYHYDKYKYIIWIDADMIFLKYFDFNLIKKLINKDNMMSYLGRSQSEGHSECGFLIFNKKFNVLKKYFNEMNELYLSKNIYKEKEWHDSYIWDLIRIKYEKEYNIKNFNISKYFYKHLKDKNINKNEFMSKNILLKIPLNKYLLHLKGTKNKENKKITTQKEDKIYLFDIDL
jgi:hypothetical protein